jgi:hypothetical protein
MPTRAEKQAARAGGRGKKSFSRQHQRRAMGNSIHAFILNYSICYVDTMSERESIRNKIKYFMMKPERSGGEKNYSTSENNCTHFYTTFFRPCKSGRYININSINIFLEPSSGALGCVLCRECGAFPAFVTATPRLSRFELN